MYEISPIPPLVSVPVWFLVCLQTQTRQLRWKLVIVVGRFGPEELKDLACALSEADVFFRLLLMDKNMHHIIAAEKKH